MWKITISFNSVFLALVPLNRVTSLSYQFPLLSQAHLFSFLRETISNNGLRTGNSVPCISSVTFMLSLRYTAVIDETRLPPAVPEEAAQVWQVGHPRLGSVRAGADCRR